MKSLIALALAIVGTAITTVPAAADGIPEPTPQGIVRCEAGEGVLATPIGHTLLLNSWENDDWIDATPALGGQPVGDDWRDGMSGFAFDGQVDADNPVASFIWGNFGLQYRLPPAACDRRVYWQTDLRAVMPDGFRTLGHPDNRTQFRAGGAGDPSGELMVSSAFLGGYAYWPSNFVEYHQTHGQVEYIERVSGGMIVPAGQAANVFVFFSIQLQSKQGSFCIGPCVEQRPSALGQDGWFDLTAPSDPSGQTPGISFRARPVD